MFIVLNKDKIMSCFISFSIVAILLTIGVFVKTNSNNNSTNKEKHEYISSILTK